MVVSHLNSTTANRAKEVIYEPVNHQGKTKRKNPNGYEAILNVTLGTV